MKINFSEGKCSLKPSKSSDYAPFILIHFLIVNFFRAISHYAVLQLPTTTELLIAALFVAAVRLVVAYATRWPYHLTR